MALAYTALAAGVQVGGFYARHGAGSGIGGQIVSLLIGFTVAVVQGVVLRRLEATSEAERHATRSETYASLARKQTRATIFLSGCALRQRRGEGARAGANTQVLPPAASCWLLFISQRPESGR